MVEKVKHLWSHSQDIGLFPYQWCCVDGVPISKGTMKKHKTSTHSAKKLKGGQTCLNCGKDTKNRDGQNTLGQCTHCGWYWCLVENCLAEYEELSSLKLHQKMLHRI